MRNILVTVMLLIVVALLYTNIVDNGSAGLRKNIQDQGTKAIERITSLVP
jgi:hypothetical protein